MQYIPTKEGPYWIKYPDGDWYIKYFFNDGDTDILRDTVEDFSVYDPTPMKDYIERGCKIVGPILNPDQETEKK